jgi:hypothetical protein
MAEGNGVHARLAALEENLRDLRQLNLSVIADRTRRLEDDLKDFRAQHRGEAASVRNEIRDVASTVTKRIDAQDKKLGRIFWAILTTLLGAAVSVIVALSLAGVSGG